MQTCYLFFGLFHFLDIENRGRDCWELTVGLGHIQGAGEGLAA